MRGEDDAQRSVDAADFLDRDGVGEGVAAGAAVLLGEGDAHEPKPAMRLIRSAGNSWVRSRSMAPGATSFSAKSRTVSRKSWCSSDSSKSNAVPPLALPARSTVSRRRISCRLAPARAGAGRAAYSAYYTRRGAPLSNGRGSVILAPCLSIHHLLSPRRSPPRSRTAGPWSRWSRR